MELESQLEQERVNLGELRKKHYDMGGDHQGEEERGEDGDGADSFPPPPPPTLLPEFPYSQAQSSLSTSTTQGLGNNSFLPPPPS